MRRIIYILPFLLLMGCTAMDEIYECHDYGTMAIGAQIEYAISDIDDRATKASLVTTANVAAMFPTMEVKAFTKVDETTDREHFTITFPTSDPSSPSARYYWNQTYDSYTFYSYPKIAEVVNPVSDHGSLKFDCTISAATPDIVAAAATVSRGNPVSFVYKHVFTAVNVNYKEMLSSHTITSILIRNTIAAGRCQVSTSGIEWKKPAENANEWTYTDIEDNSIRYATHNGQDVTDSASKFMTIPGATIILEVIVDGKTLTASCPAKNPGDYVTFYINDDYTITQKDGVQEEQSITKVGDTYTLSIGSFVTGSTIVHSTSRISNSVLLLDTSGSMDETIGTAVGIKAAGSTDISFLDTTKPDGYYRFTTGAKERDLRYRNGHWEYYSPGVFSGDWYTFLSHYQDYECKFYVVKLGVLKVACTEYVNSLYITGNHHLVTIIEFETAADRKCTQLDVQTNKDGLLNIISNFGADGGTYSDKAFEDVLGRYPYVSPDKLCLMDDFDKYHNAIIFVTDGDPGLVSGIFDSEVANSAINCSNTCKTTYKTDVFVVGIFDSIKDNCNQYLDRVSSNYTNATNYSDGTRLNGADYYSLTTTDSAFSSTLKAITKRIEESAIDYEGAPYVVATISDALVLPADVVTNNMKFYAVPQESFDAASKTFTWDYDSKEELTDIVTTLNDNEFKITGFDYSAHFCGEGRNGKGKKLVVEISGLTANPNLSGSGDNEVFGYNSGLYDENAVIYEFNSLKVNI